MKFRRVAVLLLAGTMALAVTACDSDEPDTSSKREKNRDDDEDDEEESDKKSSRDDEDDEEEDWEDEDWEDDEDWDEDWDDEGDEEGWDVVEWGDDDSDESCIPGREMLDFSFDPDDPCAELYYVWQDMDNQVFDVFIEFFPNGTWESGSDGGESDGGSFVYSGGNNVTLYYGYDTDDDSAAREFTLNNKGELVNEDNGHRYANVGEISEETLQRVLNDGTDPYFMPLQDFYGYWEYEDYDDALLILYPNNIWEFSGSGTEISGEFEAIGNNEMTTLILRSDELEEPELWTFKMEGNKLVLYDADDEILKRTLKILQ